MVDFWFVGYFWHWSVGKLDVEYSKTTMEFQCTLWLQLSAVSESFLGSFAKIKILVVFWRWSRPSSVKLQGWGSTPARMARKLGSTPSTQCPQQYPIQATVPSAQLTHLQGLRYWGLGATVKSAPGPRAHDLSSNEAKFGPVPWSRPWALGWTLCPGVGLGSLGGPWVREWAPRP